MSGVGKADNGLDQGDLYSRTLKQSLTFFETILFAVIV